MMTCEDARVENDAQLKRLRDTNVHAVAGTLGMRSDAEQRYGLAGRVLRKCGEPGFAKLRKRARP